MTDLFNRARATLTIVYIFLVRICCVSIRVYVQYMITFQSTRRIIRSERRRRCPLHRFSRKILASSSSNGKLSNQLAQLFERKRHRKSANLPRKLSDQWGTQMLAPYCCPQTTTPAILPRIETNNLRGLLIRDIWTIFTTRSILGRYEYSSFLISKFGKTFPPHPSIN